MVKEFTVIHSVGKVFDAEYLMMILKNVFPPKKFNSGIALAPDWYYVNGYYVVLIATTPPRRFSPKMLLKMKATLQCA